MTAPLPYVGRFAPSPSGPLHLGSVVAALASYLDARSRAGRWLVRIEDIDTPRTVAGAEATILRQLEALGMRADGPIWRQSSEARQQRYRELFRRWRDQGQVYGCACTRRELQQVPVNASGERPYPGTCRNGLPYGRQARSWRLRVPDDRVVRFHDRWAGPQHQHVALEVGDFVVRRADGLFAYQLAVVADDVDQGITDIVRGADLLSSTARQFVLWDLLQASRPRVMHVPLICTDDGRKLSKQNGAPAIDETRPVSTLMAAWQALGFAAMDVASVSDFHGQAMIRWQQRFGDGHEAGHSDP